MRRRLKFPDLIHFGTSVAWLPSGAKERKEEQQEADQGQRRGDHDRVPETKPRASIGKGRFVFHPLLYKKYIFIQYPCRDCFQVAVSVSESVFLALAATNPELLQNQPARVPSPLVNITILSENAMIYFANQLNHQ